MIKEFAVRVPAVPSEKLFPNATAHYLTKSKLKRVLRLGAADAVPDALKDELEELRASDARPVKFAGVWPYDLRVEVVWPKGRRRPDLDAALSSCKSLLDGIADAIGIDDRNCQEITIRQRRAGKGESGSVVATYSLHDP